MVVDAADVVVVVVVGASVVVVGATVVVVAPQGPGVSPCLRCPFSSDLSHRDGLAVSGDCPADMAERDLLLRRPVGALVLGASSSRRRGRASRSLLLARTFGLLAVAALLPGRLALLLGLGLVGARVAPVSPTAALAINPRTASKRVSRAAVSRFTRSSNFSPSMNLSPFFLIRVTVCEMCVGPTPLLGVSPGQS